MGEKNLQKVTDKLRVEISVPALGTVTVTYMKGINSSFTSSLETGG